MPEKDPRIKKPENYEALHPVLGTTTVLLGVVFLTFFVLAFRLLSFWPASVCAMFTGVLCYVFLHTAFVFWIMGKKVTIGLNINDTLCWHEAGQLIDPDRGLLSMYATVRLGGFGNATRLFPIYVYDQEKRAYTCRLGWSLRKRGRTWNIFELVDADGLALYQGQRLYSLFTIARNTVSLTHALTDKNVTRQLTERVEQLEQRETQLGIPLLAIYDRLTVIKDAAKSPHGQLTFDLCEEALTEIPGSLVDTWRNAAHAKWPWIFKPTKKGEPAPTLTPPTPTAEVSA